MEIWDLHCHLHASRIPGATLSERVGNALEIAGRVDIDKLGIFLRTGGAERNAEIREALDRYRGRVFGFVWVDLEQTDEAVEKLERWVGDGPMVGLKLGGGSGIARKPEYDRVFAKAIELDTVIFQHTWIKLGGDPPYPGGGNLPKESLPEDLVEVAKRHPDYPFILGHTGGDWELGIRAVRDYDNIYAGISGGFPLQGMVEMAVRELGAERVIYGSDITGRSFGSQLAKVHGAGLTEREKRLIFRDNLHRIMRPILERKGIEV